MPYQLLDNYHLVDYELLHMLRQLLTLHICINKMCKGILSDQQGHEALAEWVIHRFSEFLQVLEVFKNS